jgi:FkbM family methyltransferase
MKIAKTLNKRYQYIVRRYQSFKTNPLTKSKPIWALVKYLYINFLLYVLKREVTITYLNGIKARVKKGDGIVGNYHSGLHEASDSIFLMQLLQEGDFLLDIGANVGHYTLLSGLYSNCKVVSIEPIPGTFDRLAANVKLNNWKYAPELLNIGLSNEAGELVFTNQQFTTNKVSTNGQGIKVKVKTLDEICAAKTPDFIKIDVEGYEWFVLNGGLKTLSNDTLKLILIELNESGKNFNIQDEQIIALLKEKGFLPYVYDLDTHTFNEVSSKNTNQFNTLFIKDLSFVENRIKEASSNELPH